MIKETKGLEQSREENINEYINNKENILNYLRLRFEHDKRLEELNFEHSKQLAPIEDKLNNYAISLYRINSCILFYTKMNNNLNISEIKNNIYDLIISDLGFRYKPTYLECGETIKTYITLKLLLKQEKSNLKIIQHKELNKIKQPISKLESFSYIISLYNTLKLEVKFYNKNISSELYQTEYFSDLSSFLNEIKSQLFNEQTDFKYVKKENFDESKD